MERAHYVPPFFFLFITVLPILQGNISHAVEFSEQNIICGFESCSIDIRDRWSEAEGQGIQRRKMWRGGRLNKREDKTFFFFLNAVFTANEQRSSKGSPAFYPPFLFPAAHVRNPP